MFLVFKTHDRLIEWFSGTESWHILTRLSKLKKDYFTWPTCMIGNIEFLSPLQKRINMYQQFIRKSSVFLICNLQYHNQLALYSAWLRDAGCYFWFSFFVLKSYFFITISPKQKISKKKKLKSPLSKAKLSTYEVCGDAGWVQCFGKYTGCEIAMDRRW